MVSLYCTVCCLDYLGIEEWLGHLLEDEHQEKGRKELVKRCLQKEYAKVFVAVYSKKSVASNQLLKYFSKDIGTIVTDFVWWRDKPKVGFVQFESEKKVKEILLGIGDSKEVRIGNQLFQVKPASEILSLEWEVLLPSTPEVNGVSDMHVREPSRRRSSGVQESDGDSFPQDLIQIQTSLPSLTLTKVKEPPTVFQSVLNKILKSLEVTENQFRNMQRVQKELHKIFDENQYVVNIGLFQTWPIRLKQKKDNCPFFAIQRKFRNKSFVKMDISTVRSRILKDSKSPLSKKFKLLVNKPNETKWSFYSCLLYKVKLNAITFSFKVTGCHKSTHWSKIWEMINYLCQFNPLCKRLLAVIYHWANTNLVKVGERRSSNQDPKYDQDDEYFLLTLLVILFLSAEGHIPTFGEVISQNQSMGKLYYAKVNIGFAKDPKYVSSWRKTAGICDPDNEDTAFAKKVFIVASRFFLHYGNTLVDGRWVINSETGRMFKADEILSDACLKGSETESNRKEVALLKNALANKIVSFSSLDRILLTHPSTMDWHVKISNDPAPFQAMKTTGGKLKEFLYRNSCNKNEKLESLMKVLVI